MSTRISADALVSLPFTAMIPIDCKITIFSNTCFTFFCNNYYMPASFAFACTVYSPCCTVLDRGDHVQYLFLPPYGNTENSLVTMTPPESISHSERVVSHPTFLELGRAAQD